MRLGNNEQRRTPLDVRESFLNRVGQRRLGRTDDSRSAPRDAAIDAERLLIGWGNGWRCKNCCHEKKDREKDKMPL
jgi:hypothetical protein